MKVLVGLFVLAVVACQMAFADIETCTDVSDCSEAMRNKCSEMSQSLKGAVQSQKLVLACKNGICMCNMEFEGGVRHSSQPENYEEHNDEAERVDDF